MAVADVEMVDVTAGPKVEMLEEMGAGAVEDNGPEKPKQGKSGEKVTRSSEKKRRRTIETCWGKVQQHR